MTNEEINEIYGNSSRDRDIITIEIVHESSNLRRFYCKSATDLNITIEDGTTHIFKPSSFAITNPKYEENNSVDMTFTFGMVGFEDIQIIEDIMRHSTDDITMYYRIYTEKNLNAPQTQLPFKFTVKNISMENMTMGFTGSLLKSVSNRIPNELYTYDKFPALRGLK